MEKTTAQEKTDIQYHKIIAICQELFIKKAADYGTSWRILRLPSITDQIYIKAARIRAIQEKDGKQEVGDSIKDEFIGMVNYSVMALIQMGLSADTPMEMPTGTVVSSYKLVIEEIVKLHHAKNSDYGEAWRDMRISSITDIILMKLLRIKQIENNDGKTIVSEGIKAGYQDIVNYSVFSLIKMMEDEQR